MTQLIPHELFASNLFALLEETFENVGGIYLDGGTSLLETLATISAAEASRPTTASGTTIAAQVFHARFYIRVLRDYIDGKSQGKIDWKESWSLSSVTDAEWDAIRNQLAGDFREITSYLKGIVDWNEDRRLGGALAIVVHTAYHLGAIRQILRGVKEKARNP